jgi:hypothetical protein
VRAELKQSSPASRTRVRVASAISVDGYGGQGIIHRMRGYVRLKGWG